MLPSFGTISTTAAQIFILICVSCIYVFFVSTVFPSVFLKPRYRDTLEGDRGLKKYSFEGGRAIVYEPSLEAKRYLKQYILSAVGNEKYVQCKFDAHIFSAKYEIAAFDCDDRMIDAVQVEEPDLDEKRGIASPVLLPTDTAYVRASVKTVNDLKLDREPMLEISHASTAVFTFFTVLWTVLEAFIMKIILMNLAEDFFSYASVMKDHGNLMTLCLGVFMGLLLAFFGRLLHGLGRRDRKDLKMQSKKKARK